MIPEHVDGLIRDIRYACRAFARAPGFAFIAVLIMAVGVGANAVSCRGR